MVQIRIEDKHKMVTPRLLFTAEEKHTIIHNPKNYPEMLRILKAQNKQKFEGVE